MVSKFSNIITVFNIDLPVSIKQLKTGEESNCTEIGYLGEITFFKQLSVIT